MEFGALSTGGTGKEAGGGGGTKSTFSGGNGVGAGDGTRGSFVVGITTWAWGNSSSFTSALICSGASNEGSEPSISEVVSDSEAIFSTSEESIL